MLSQPRILVCTDFSPMSDKALMAASQLAQKTRGEIHLLHVADIGFYLEWGSYGIYPVDNRNQFNELIISDLKRRMRDQLEKCQVKAKTDILIDSNAQKGIEKKALDMKADLIVVGCRGASGLERILVGSLTRKLAFHSDFPLLVIKENSSMDSFAALVSGDKGLQPVLNLVQELSLLYSSRLNVISVFPRVPGLYFGAGLEYTQTLTPDMEEVREKFLSSMHAKIKQALGNVEAKITITSAFDVPKAIADKLTDDNVSTVVLKRSQKSLGDRILERSVSAALLEDFKGNFFIC